MPSGVPVLIESFDLYNAVSAFEAPGKWDSYTNASSAFSFTSGGRFATGNSLKLNNTATNGRLGKNLPAGCNRVQIGFAFRLNALPSGEQRFLSMPDNFGNRGCRLQVTSAGKLKLYSWASGSQEQTGTLPTGSWVWIEWIAFMDGSNGTHEVWVDGVKVINYGPTDTTVSGGSTSYQAVEIGGDLQVNIDCDIDDFVVANATGITSPTLWGDSRISVIQPTSVAQNVGFDPVGAGTVTDTVNGLAPADDATYSEADTVDDVLMLASTGTLPAGVSLVHAVGVNLRHRKTAAGARAVQAGVRMGGTNYFSGTDVNLFETTSSSQHCFQNNPATSSAWTKSTAEDAEFGLKVVT